MQLSEWFHVFSVFYFVTLFMPKYKKKKRSDLKCVETD